jgi:hypothetical protein
MGPVVGGKYSGFVLLGDVSTEGITTVLIVVGAFYAKCLDKIVFWLSTRHRTGVGRWLSLSRRIRAGFFTSTVGQN